MFEIIWPRLVIREFVSFFVCRSFEQEEGRADENDDINYYYYYFLLPRVYSFRVFFGL